MIHLFYNLYLGLAWEPVAEEFAAAAREVPGDLHVGLIGPECERERARGVFPGAGFTEAGDGWEMVTLRQLWRAAAQEDAFLFYGHSKGTFHPGPRQATWRRSMTRHLLGGWEECVRLLAGVDAVGCHCIPDASPALVRCGSGTIAGNFWWANASYVCGLPEPPLDAVRSYGEQWITFGNPRVADVRPGWFEGAA